MGDTLHLRVSVVLIVAFNMAAISSASDSQVCGFRVAPTGRLSAEVLLGKYPASLLAELESTGVAFAPASTRKGCDGYSHAFVYFSQPRERVLELLSQTARQGEFLSHKIVSVYRSGNESIDEHRMYVLFTRLFYRVRNTWDPNQWTIMWHLDPEFDNSLLMLRGYWYLHSYKGGTLGVYGSKVDAGRIVPTSLQAVLTTKKLRRVIQHFRKWVDSNGSYRP
jgi:hypothetical protein